MIDNLPNYVSILFGVTTFLTAFIFYKATKQSKPTLIILSIWLIIQFLVGLTPFYKETTTLPPRMMLLIVPVLLLIIVGFVTKKGKQYIDSLDVTLLTYIHTVRIPVECVLLFLFLNNKIPQLMTFEGRNFDIIIGITAPLIAYFGITKKRLNKTMIVAWNVAGIGFLSFVVFHGILSVPTPFQQFGFDQPTIAMLYSPFVWLPCFIVPTVLFSHLVCIRKYLKK